MIAKLLQWNVWRKEEPTKIASEIKRFNPDIVCAQELFENTNQSINTYQLIFEELNSKYQYFYKEAVTWDKRPDVTSQGNAIYSKFPIVNKRWSFVSPFIHNPLNASKEGRVYIECDLQINEKVLTIGTTHLAYSYALRNYKRRRTEADNLSKCLEKHSKNFIFTGDLNSVPKSYVVKKVLENKNLINAGPNFGSPTWTTKPFEYHGFKLLNLNLRVDYVFATKDIKIKSSEILETKFSDHLPILTILDFS